MANILLSKEQEQANNWYAAIKSVIDSNPDLKEDDLFYQWLFLQNMRQAQRLLSTNRITKDFLDDLYENFKNKFPLIFDETIYQQLDKLIKEDFDLGINWKSFSIDTEKPKKNPPTNDNPKLRIDISKRQLIFEELKKYFPETDYENLQLLINDKPIEKRLSFNAKASVLIEFFRRLSYNKILSADYSEISLSLIKNFNYKESKPFQKNSIPPYLNGDRDINKFQRIGTEIAGFIKKSVLDQD